MNKKVVTPHIKQEEIKKNPTPVAKIVSKKCTNCEGAALITTNVARGIQKYCPRCDGTGLEPVNG